ncbi:hypothetical protein [Chrysiogenes arsenatis]|uniref:hypothetical protein n=1 Tax=Chrysiogenes arsenatis TaxID=309797 RepID=UPI00040B3676|nr:hypothetical protein [Chrysiogenes arsenatis]
MSDDQKGSVMSREKILEKAKNLATPINFEDLIANGILEKKGAWYKILDMERLPEHAKDKITEFASDGMVKFLKATKSAQKLVDKLSK